MLGHTVQTTLMARHYRKFDSQAAIAARGLSLGITMMPLLILSRHGSLIQIISHPLPLIAAALLTAIGNWSAAVSVRYLPVGMATAGHQGFLVITASVIGLLAFGEQLSVVEWLGIAVILAANSTALIKPRNVSLQWDRHTATGLMYCAFFGILVGTGVSLVTGMARKIDPFAAAYAWELSIGLFSALILAIRKTAGTSDGESIGPAAFGKILLCSAPTAVGTAFFALAVTRGPIGIVTAVASTIVIMTSVLAFFLYHERLSFRQILAVGIIAATIAIIRLAPAIDKSLF